MAINFVICSLLERCQTIMFFWYLSGGSKSRKVGPRCGQRGTLGTKAGARVVDFQEPRPPGGGPKYTHASKERRGRQKERRTKKERVRHVENGTKGFEHARGQRPGEFFLHIVAPVKIHFGHFSIFIFFDRHDATDATAILTIL